MVSSTNVLSSRYRGENILCPVLGRTGPMRGYQLIGGYHIESEDESVGSQVMKRGVDSR